MLVVARKEALLTLTIGEKKHELHPESQNVFFTTDRDLTFEFEREGEKASQIVVLEHGAVVEHATVK